jgi:hypothetical protein
MERWRRYDESSVAPDVEALLEPHVASHPLPGMSEIKVAASSSGHDFHGAWQYAVGLFQLLQTLGSPVTGIDVEHDEPRYTTRHDRNVEIRATSEPGVDLAP